MRKLVLLVICFSLLFIVSCSDKEKKEEVQNVDSSILITTAPATGGTYSPLISYSGTFKPIKEANIASTIPGKIEKIYYREGRNVKKGAILVRMSNDLYKQAKAELDAVQKDYDKVKDLVDKKVVTEQQLDHLQAKLDVSIAKTSMFRKSVEITAPFSGIVAQHLMNAGENYFINPGLEPGYSHASGIVRIMDTKQLLIEINVDEKDLSLIRSQKKITIKVDAMPDLKLEGEIYEIGSMVSVISRTFKVKIKVDNLKRVLKPGMFARISMNLPEKEAVIIPRMAVLRLLGSNQKYVFTIDNNIAKRNIVEIVSDLGENLAVSGIKAGSVVAVAGKTKLKDGSKVRISEGK